MASLVTVTRLSPPASSIDQKTIDYYFNIAVAAGTYTTGGLAMSLSGLVHAPGIPLEARIFSFASPNSGYTYAYNPDADDQNGGLLQAFLGGVEVAAGATPAAVTGDTIRAIIKFRRG